MTQERIDELEALCDTLEDEKNAAISATQYVEEENENLKCDIYHLRSEKESLEEMLGEFENTETWNEFSTRTEKLLHDEQFLPDPAEDNPLDHEALYRLIDEHVVDSRQEVW